MVMLYHRLPYEVSEVNGRTVHMPPKSPNGIIPTLLGFFNTGRSGAWIAWEETAGKKHLSLKDIYIDEEQYPNLVASRISLTKKDVEIFYKNFSKEAFWPILFSFIDKAKFNHAHWEHYCKINRIFAEKAATEADHNAIIWIHEYNLWMVPAYLRQLRPDVKIGFFHHTSFPPADIFNIIPWRREIMGSLLQCDYIGFHIPRYVENFVDVARSHTPVKVLAQENCAGRFLTYSCALGVDLMSTQIETASGKVKLGANPVGVNIPYIREIYEQEKTQEAIREMAAQTNGKKIILSIERLDYVKGPLEKLRAFSQFLHDYPEFHGKVELINICTPPAQGMKIYDRIQTDLEQEVGRINGKYSNLDWTPIRFFLRSVPFEEVVVYYALADICWITPLRDGLNLVGKEYVAVQGQKEVPDGALIVSEFAGVSV
jgi:glucosylglycerol-phosphate synthase